MPVLSEHQNDDFDPNSIETWRSYDVDMPCIEFLSFKMEPMEVWANGSGYSVEVWTCSPGNYRFSSLVLRVTPVSCGPDHMIRTEVGVSLSNPNDELSSAEVYESAPIPRILSNWVLGGVK